MQSSIYLAQALIATNKPADAQQELDRALNRAEKLGLLVEQARAHYLLGEVLSAGGKTNEYAPQYQEAVRILESISKENGAGRLLDRSDLKDVYRTPSSRTKVLHNGGPPKLARRVPPKHWPTGASYGLFSAYRPFSLAV